MPKEQRLPLNLANRVEHIGDRIGNLEIKVDDRLDEMWSDVRSLMETMEALEMRHGRWNLIDPWFPERRLDGH